jgi:hypothetical protein
MIKRDLNQASSTSIGRSSSVACKYRRTAEHPGISIVSSAICARRIGAGRSELHRGSAVLENASVDVAKRMFVARLRFSAHRGGFSPYVRAAGQMISFTTGTRLAVCGRRAAGVYGGWSGAPCG